MSSLENGVFVGTSPDNGKKMYAVDVLESNFNQVSSMLSPGISIPTVGEFEVLRKSEAGRAFAESRGLLDRRLMTSTPAKGNEDHYVVARYINPRPHEEKVDLANDIENRDCRTTAGKPAGCAIVIRYE